MSRPIVLLLGQPFNTYMPVKNRQTGSGVAKIWRYGGQTGSGERKSQAGSRGRALGGVFGGEVPRKLTAYYGYLAAKPCTILCI